MYFLKRKFKSIAKKNNYVLGLSFYKPKSGDVLKFFFSQKGAAFFFEGLCYKIFRQGFFLPDVSLFLVNKIQGVSVSFVFSFFYNLIFSYEIVSFKKKKKFFRSSKLFYMIRGNKFFVKS